MKLEELERRLRNDVMHESMQWEGQVLLHRCRSSVSSSKFQHAQKLLLTASRACMGHVACC